MHGPTHIFWANLTPFSLQYPAASPKAFYWAFGRYCLGPPCLTPSAFSLCKSVLYCTFVWVRRALNRQKRRFPARAGNPNLYACGKVCLSLLGTWQVRKTPSWHRSWANSSRVELYSCRIAWANLRLLGQPKTLFSLQGPGWTPESTLLQLIVSVQGLVRAIIIAPLYMENQYRYFIFLPHPDIVAAGDDRSVALSLCTTTHPPTLHQIR
jgi:hypothetical protein